MLLQMLLPKAARYYETGYTVDQVPDLTGKVAIVTGGNTGLGYETVLQLAKKGARVFMASRSEERATAALEKLKTDIGAEAAGRVEFLKLDLQDLKQVKQAAQEFLAKDLPLHILVNNAGIMACPFALTKDGIESQMGTNHVGHFAFTMGLLPALEKETPSRVVNLSSFGHRFAPEGGILFDKINDESALDAWGRYGQSKLANILFSKGLDKRYGDRGIYANAAHPGFVATELSRGLKELYGLETGWRRIVRMMWDFLEWTMFIDAGKGALTQIYVATSPDIVKNGVRGKYFVPFGKQFDDVTEAAKSEKLADDLWTWSEKTIE